MRTVLWWGLLLLCIQAHGKALRDIWRSSTVPEWAKRTLVQIDSSGATQGPDRILAPNCEYPVSPLRVPVSAKQLPIFDGKLSDSANYIRGLVALLGQFPEASGAAQKFLQAYEANEIEVLLLTKEALAQRSIVGATAICEVLPNSKKIYIDKTAQIGEALPIFYHEMIHCVDDEVKRDISYLQELMAETVNIAAEMGNGILAAKNLSEGSLLLSDFNPKQIEVLRRAKQRVEQFDQFRSYRSERRAYDGEHAAGKWLIEKDKSYFQMRGRAPSSFITPISDDFIVERYGFRADWFQKYKSGQCDSPGTAKKALASEPKTTGSN